MTDLTGIDLAALIERDGVTLRGQGERYGACPKCGGSDRFHVRSYQGRGYFFCRQCHEQRGDAIEYLRWLHGMTYGEALRALGIEGDRQALPAARRPAPKTSRGVVIPDALEDPPCAAWQGRARAFAEACAGALWAPGGARALDYLRGRGLSDDTIRRAGLGFNAKRRESDAAAWELTDREHVYAAAGVTIPTTYGGDLWRVNVRRLNADGTPYAGDDKYLCISGSRAQLFNGDVLAIDGVHTVIVCAGEFDAMLAQQHAPAGVACITYGSESKGITWEADYLLRGKRVLIAYDNDPAGDQGAARWAAFGERVRVPNGAKDLTDYGKAGGDVAAWLRSLIDAGAAVAATNGAPGAFGWPDDYLAAMLAALGRQGYAPRITPAGGLVCEREAVTA